MKQIEHMIQLTYTNEQIQAPHTGSATSPLIAYTEATQRCRN